MADVLKTLQEILSKKLPDDQVQALMTELTIASGNGAVAIAGSNLSLLIPML